MSLLTAAVSTLLCLIAYIATNQALNQDLPKDLASIIAIGYYASIGGFTIFAITTFVLWQAS